MLSKHCNYLYILSAFISSIIIDEIIFSYKLQIKVYFYIHYNCYKNICFRIKYYWEWGEKKNKNIFNKKMKMKVFM